MGGRSGWNSTSSRRRFTALFTMRAGNFPPAGTISRRLRYRLPISSGPPFFQRTTAQRPAVPGSSRRQALICSAGGSGQGGSSSSHRRRPKAQLTRASKPFHMSSVRSSRWRTDTVFDSHPLLSATLLVNIKKSEFSGMVQAGTTMQAAVAPCVRKSDWRQMWLPVESTPETFL